MNAKSYAANVTGQGAARILFMLAGVVAFVLIARLSGPVTLGRYSVVLAIISVAAMAADFGSTLILGADLAQASAGAARQAVFGRFLLARLVLVVPPAIAMIAVAPLVDPMLRWPLVFAAMALPLLAARFFDPIFQIEGRPTWTLWLSAPYAAVLIVGTLAVSTMSAEPDTPLLLVFVAASAVYGGVGLVLACRLLSPRFDPVGWRAYGLRLLPVGLSNLFGMLNARIGLFMLWLLADADAAGLFNAGFRFFEVAVAAAMTLVTPLVPVLAAASDDPDRFIALVRRSLVQLLALTTPLAVVTPVFAPLAVRMLYGERFLPSAFVLDVMAWTSVVMMAASILFVALVAAKTTRFAAWSSGLGAVVNGIVCVGAIPRLGIDGASLAGLVGEAVMLAINGLAFRRRFGAPIERPVLRRLAIANGALALSIALTPASVAPLAASLGLCLYAALVAAPLIGRRPFLETTS